MKQCVIIIELTEVRAIWGNGIYYIAIVIVSMPVLRCRSILNCAGKALRSAVTRKHDTALYSPQAIPPSGWA